MNCNQEALFKIVIKHALYCKQCVRCWGYKSKSYGPCLKGMDILVWRTRGVKNYNKKWELPWWRHGRVLWETCWRSASIVREIARLLVCWEKFLRGSLISVWLVNRETDNFLLNYLLRMLYSKQTILRLEIISTSRVERFFLTRKLKKIFFFKAKIGQISLQPL